MAGNKQQQKKFSVFSIFKSRKGRRDHPDNYYDNNALGDSNRRIWPSDYDKGSHWFAEPGIDSKASDFILKFHKTQVSESERHAVYQAEA